MEVHQVHRRAVGTGLRLGQTVVHRPGLLQNRGGEAQVGDPVLHIVEAAVGMMVRMAVLVVVFMVMRMLMLVVVMVIHALLPLPVHHHVHVGAGDAAGLGGEGVKFHPLQPHMVEGMEKFLPVGEQLVEGGGEHIAGGPHVTLQV